MEPRFICEFDVSYEEYKYRARHPLGAAAVRNRRLSFILRLAGIVLSVLIIALGAMSAGSPYVFVGIAFLIIFLGRALLSENLILKKQYETVLKAQKDGVWTRGYIFAEKLSVADGRAVSEYEYSELARLTEDERYFVLWLNGDMVMRLPKDRFTVGNPEEFRGFIENKLVR